VQKAPAAHEAFARILAEDQAVDACEVVLLVALAGAGPGELAGIACAFFTRSGVAGWEERKSGARGSI